MEVFKIIIDFIMSFNIVVYGFTFTIFNIVAFTILIDLLGYIVIKIIKGE